MKPCMLRSYAGIVQSSRDGVYRRYLTELILTKVGFHAVKYPRSSCSDSGCGILCINPTACRFTSDKSDLLIFDKVIESPYGIGATPHARQYRIRKPAFFFKDLCFYLF